MGVRQWSQRLSKPEETKTGGVETETQNSRKIGSLKAWHSLIRVQFVTISPIRNITLDWIFGNFRMAYKDAFSPRKAQ